MPLNPRRSWTTIAGVTALVVLALVLASVVIASRIEPRLHATIVRTLEERFDSQVTLADIQVSLLPSPRLEGRGLELRYQGRTDLPPLISVQHFSGTASFWTFLLARHVDEITLDGLEVTIPPRRTEEMPELGRDDEAAADEEEKEASTSTVIGRLIAANTRLTVLSRDPGKDPKVFDIYRLELTSVSVDGPADFGAELTIPTPEGLVKGEGRFGPWHAEEPSLTPLDGEFTFDADLGTIKGIAGTLTSGGSFGGVLERITATGTTRTPDFRLPSLTNAAVPLETAFEGVVDGTNGDVYLTRVRARLGGSAFETSGAIVRNEGGDGRRVTLDVTASQARIDDFLRLTVDGQRPPMTGTMQVEGRLDIPPGDADMVDKLALDGRFSLRQARFQSAEVQQRIDELSRRAQGRPDDEALDDELTDIEGRFAMKDAVLILPNVTFAVTGARVEMAGTYGLRTEALNFRGDVRMDASASQMTTGVKSWLLKPFDALLRKHGAGTRVAIKVEGTRDKPDFGIEVGRTLRGK
jgi:hypothetical protein